MSDDTRDRKALVTGARVDLDERDPDYIRSQLPWWWLMATGYFRAEIDGLERIPDGPVLLVGNHSGGALTPDTLILMLAWNTYFTVERPLYALGHAILTQVPLLGSWVRRLGVVTADIGAAQQAFDRGASVLVYPGGDVEVFRPYRQRHQVDFAGRQGFLKVAHAADVPIVPVVATGGHDTLLILTDGRRLARLLRLDKLGRLKVLPFALSAPWGLSPALIGHLPFPAKIRLEVLEPIDLRQRFGDAPDWGEAYRFVTSRMQAGLSALAARRVLPPIR